MLKKAFKAGQEAQAAGRNPLACGPGAAEAATASGGARCSVASVAAADAHMAALLQELQLEEEGCAPFQTRRRFLICACCAC